MNEPAYPPQKEKANKTRPSSAAYALHAQRLGGRRIRRQKEKSQ
jgi:hypothetical protein